MIKEIWSAVCEPSKRRLILRLLCIYLIVAVPFKTLDLLPGLANIRPNSALLPVYGFLFGPVGAWATALGNCGYDLITDSFYTSSIAGMAANFCVPLFMCALWLRLFGKRFQLTSLRDLGWYTLISAAGAFLKTMLITPVVIWTFPEVSGEAFAIAVFSTDFTFYIVPGAAILIFMQSFYGFKGYMPGQDVKKDKNILP